MKLDKPIYFGILLKRYKRFLADIKLETGEYITAHCPNSGSMLTCKEPGWKVVVSDSMNDKRKLRYTFEMIHNTKCWIGINTMTPNKIVKEAIQNNMIAELKGYDSIKTEQKYSRNSRIDLLLAKGDEQCYVEVKNVSYVKDKYFLFPDAVTERGLKHLADLEQMVKAGHRAVMLYVIQRNDAEIFAPANEIDPVYAKKLSEVHRAGVEILPYLAKVSPQEILIEKKVEFEF